MELFEFSASKLKEKGLLDLQSITEAKTKGQPKPEVLSEKKVLKVKEPSGVKKAKIPILNNRSLFKHAKLTIAEDESQVKVKSGETFSKKNLEDVPDVGEQQRLQKLVIKMPFGSGFGRSKMTKKESRQIRSYFAPVERVGEPASASTEVDEEAGTQEPVPEPDVTAEYKDTEDQTKHITKKAKVKSKSKLASPSKSFTQDVDQSVAQITKKRGRPKKTSAANDEGKNNLDDNVNITDQFSSSLNVETSAEVPIDDRAADVLVTESGSTNINVLTPSSDDIHHRLDSPPSQGSPLSPGSAVRRKIGRPPKKKRKLPDTPKEMENEMLSPHTDSAQDSSHIPLQISDPVIDSPAQQDLTPVAPSSTSSKRKRGRPSKSAVVKSGDENHPTTEELDKASENIVPVEVSYECPENLVQDGSSLIKQQKIEGRRRKSLPYEEHDENSLTEFLSVQNGVHNNDPAEITAEYILGKSCHCSSFLCLVACIL